jgi:hypothetical protein
MFIDGSHEGEILVISVNHYVGSQEHSFKLLAGHIDAQKLFFQSCILF